MDRDKRIRDAYEGVLLTGKGLTYGFFELNTGNRYLVLLYLTEELLKNNGKELKGKLLLFPGAGNVAIYMPLKKLTS